MCIYILCVILSHCLFSLFKNSYAANFFTGLKPTFSIRVVLASRGCLCC